MQPATNRRLPRLVIIGASCRAAAQSAVRAGWRPWCADLFADQDTAAAGEVVQVSKYPHELFRAAAAAPPACWIYTGGLECFPRQIDRLARLRRLLGNAGASLRAARDPWQLSPVAASAGVPLPPMRPATDPPADGGWLRKSARSSGGLQVAVWRPAAKPPARRQGPVYFQRRIIGRSGSSVYLAAEGRAVLIGSSLQWADDDWSGAQPFHYVGSVGPIELGSRREPLRILGERLAEAFQLQGLFGVDWIDDGQRLFTLEMNPRYTSSMELFERAWNISLLACHERACRDGDLSVEAGGGGGQCHGKAVVYGRRDGWVGDALQRLLRRWSSRRPPAAADIPAAGQQLPAGRPICTVLAGGRDPEAVERQLQSMADAVQQAAERAGAAADPRSRRRKS